MMNTERQQTELNLDGVFDSLRRPLDLIDNPERRADIERFIAAARIHQERAIFDLLSDVAGAINRMSPGTRVRLEYNAGRLNVGVDESAATAEAEPVFEDGGEVERVTIRMPAKLKALIDEAAASYGASVNSWYVRTLSRAVAWHSMHHHAPPPGWQPWFGHRGRGRGRRGDTAD